MNTRDRIERAATLLLAAHREHRRITTLPEDCRPRSLADAYAIQDTVAAHLWPAGASGWKTGAPGPTVEPIAAPIGPELIFANAVTIPAGAFHMLGIEGELAYRLGEDLPPGSHYDRTRISAAVASIHAAIEIVDARLQDWETTDPLSKLADNQSNGALVVGDGRIAWRDIEPTAQRALLSVDGERLADTVGGNAAGDPLRLLVWLANHCAQRGGGLRAGDIVTTGTHTGLVFVRPGAEVVVEFPGIGAARVTFAV